MTQANSARMPAIFIGHGSPMNALEDNATTRAWRNLGATIEKPKAILAISAHWTTRGTQVTAMDAPRTIHDFGGFPQALFDMQYPAPGDPLLAARVRDVLAPLEVGFDQDWGLDHGTWSVLCRMFPDARVPVVQLSIDTAQPPSHHIDLGRRLSVLRDEGVLLLATGNVVHNLRMMRWNSNEAYPWAQRFNDRVRNCVLQADLEQLAGYAEWGDDAALSVPTPEHFLPLFYIVGSRREDDTVTIPVDGIEHASISMLSVVLA